MFWNLGQESGIYDTEIRTDMKWVTNKVPGEGETFNAPVIVEDQTFPAMRHLPMYLRLVDEMYSPREWSHEKANVLMRLDETKLDYRSARPGSKSGEPIGRPDKDQAIRLGEDARKGRVFYLSLGHTKEAWENLDIRKMYLESVKWVLTKTEGSVTPHPKVD